jgi:hypothetical protein
MMQHRLWESLMDWDQVKVAFKSKWERAVDLAAAHHHFHKDLAQKPGEPLHDFNVKFDVAAERARATDPVSLATTYFYALQDTLQRKMIFHVLSTKGQEAADKVPFLPLMEKRTLAAEVVALDSMLSARNLSRLGSGIPLQSSSSSKGSLHAFEGIPPDGDFDDEEAESFAGAGATWDSITDNGAINMLNSNGGRNSFSGRGNYSAHAHGNTVVMPRGGAANRKRKSSQPQGSGRTHHPSTAASHAAFVSVTLITPVAELYKFQVVFE